MPRPRKYDDELKQRAVRLTLESGRPIAHVAADLGIGAESLRGWVRQAQADAGGDLHAPFGGGLKASSFGTREQGRAARDFFTETPTISVSL